MTKLQRIAIVLTVLNLVLLVFLLGHTGPVLAQSDSILRARGLELVDEAGRVRAQFNVEPGGEAVFRLRDAQGTIRVKLGAGENGSGLLLLDETTEPAVQIIARRQSTAEWPKTTSILLSGTGGQQKVITP